MTENDKYLPQPQRLNGSRAAGEERGLAAVGVAVKIDEHIDPSSRNIGRRNGLFKEREQQNKELQ